METQALKDKVRELLRERAVAAGFPGGASYVNWALLNTYMDLSRAQRNKQSFHQYVIQELSK